MIPWGIRLLAHASLQFAMARAKHQMVIDHSGGLHVGIDDRATHKLEATSFQVGTDLIG